MRIELRTKGHLHDSRDLGIKKKVERALGYAPREVGIVDVLLLQDGLGVPEAALKDLFCDQVAQEVFINQAAVNVQKVKPHYVFEISWKPGVTDPVAMTARSALGLELGRKLGPEIIVQTAQQFWFTFERPLKELDLDRLGAVLYNPLIQREERLRADELKQGQYFPALYKTVNLGKGTGVQTLPVHAMSDQDLMALSKERLLALTLDEMRVIRSYYADEGVRSERLRAGIGADATDVEVEMLAQSWSEHCKHKIFSAHIDYVDEATGNRELIPGLFKSYIKKTTEHLAPQRPDLRSVFHDNAGVVDFDDDHVVCFKVETHNSPSALDPYGGAITGIVGVNRDILGTGKGASPIFNTNYLCFADPDTADFEVPQGLLHPRRIMSGVHQGIIDGGNQSGIPTVAGGFLFDETYLGKPLVYCGTGGLMPRTINGEASWVKKVLPGDYAVMIGGRIGKDGIHGATFSSLALDEESPSSAVQIGDPITQRKVWDFLIEARDQGLYRGITDNGAGGLSSSLGEMAQDSGGIRVDLDRCPLKYPGLEPWEIWVSESQERMSLAVDPELYPDFAALAAKHHVESSVVGVFTDSGKVELYHDDKPVGLLAMNFVHEGLPPMKLEARWPRDAGRGKSQAPRSIDKVLTPQVAKEVVLRVLAHPNVRSKEPLVRQYDHEVQARTLRQPYRGSHQDAPSDGSLVNPVRGSIRGLSVTHGVCPRVGDDDAYTMAVNAVDEAYRSHIAMAGDPWGASALDNFCWPDPVASESTPDGAFKLAQLVRANKGLRDACLAYGVPLVSGKDSMKNDARIGGKKISIRPTLLISMMGIVPDTRLAPAGGFTTPGQLIVRLGPWQGELGGSVLENLVQAAALKDLGIKSYPHLGKAPVVDLSVTPEYFRRVSQAINLGLVESIHDISDGGLVTALLESAFHHRLGFEVTLPDGGALLELFSEAPSSYVASIRPENLSNLQDVVGDEWVTILGETRPEPEAHIAGIFGGVPGMLDLPLEQALSAWKKGW